MCLVSICAALLIPATRVWCATDDDTTLEFYWSPATGNVHHYNVYLFIYDGPDAPGPSGEDDYVLVDTTFRTSGSAAPSPDNLYTLNVTIENDTISPSTFEVENAKGYQLKVAAADVDGNVGPKSEASDIVWCRLPRIRGDVNSDGSITRDDAQSTLDIAVQLENPTDYQKWAADMNGDGRARSDDAGLILRILDKADSLVAPDEYTITTNPGSQVKVLLSETHGIAGENIRVPIRIHEADTVRSGDICIAYDGGVLRAHNISSAPDVLMASNGTEPGILRIAFAHAGRRSGPIMFEMQFTILKDDVSSLIFKSIELYGDDGRPLRSSGMDGKFSSWAIPPEHSALLQNFPNPFNPETWIPYQLRKDSEVTIRIYSSSGKLVRRLTSGHRSAGHYVSQDRAVHWDGRNEVGEIVASGVYFAVLKAGDYQQIRRMSLIR